MGEVGRFQGVIKEWGFRIGNQVGDRGKSKGKFDQFEKFNECEICITTKICSDIPITIRLILVLTHSIWIISPKRRFVCPTFGMRSSFDFFQHFIRRFFVYAPVIYHCVR